MIAGIVVSLLSKYLTKLATEQFAHWVFFRVAEAIVASTKTKEDDVWLAKIKETVES